MISTLTRSRSANYHRSAMLKVLIVSLVVVALWEPIRPIRLVTADALSTVATMVAR